MLISYEFLSRLKKTLDYKLPLRLSLVPHSLQVCHQCHIAYKTPAFCMVSNRGDGSDHTISSRLYCDERTTWAILVVGFTPGNSAKSHLCLL